ncbi:hypothetical protein Tco_0616943, partial [Tanacetum coccineum]
GVWPWTASEESDLDGADNGKTRAGRYANGAGSAGCDPEE